MHTAPGADVSQISELSDSRANAPLSEVLKHFN